MLLVLLPRSTVTSDRLFWTTPDQVVASHSLFPERDKHATMLRFLTTQEHLLSWLPSHLLSEDSGEQHREV